MGNDIDLKKIFFYAQDSAEYYDQLEYCIQPQADLIHDTMIDLLEYSIKFIKFNTCTSDMYILNIGSGTGAETLRILNRFKDVHIVCVDFNNSMNKVFLRKYKEKYPNDIIDKNVTIIENDYFGDECTPIKLCSKIPSAKIPRKFDAVISGFFLAHYPIEKMKEFYINTVSCLKQDGILILCDDFSFDSQNLCKIGKLAGHDWIKKSFESCESNLLSELNIDLSKLNILRDKWLYHWDNNHFRYPDIDLKCLQTEQNANDGNCHAKLAIDAGYKEIGFPFRLFETGILWAKT